ncbi:hypothetical protein ACIA8O_21915 [Kitasatospora sp. NPDC051853]|uniref:hypothetical protein n=1 Tax=Kitasatospora sp. NPDC051853 TaxID=3364058 RepID=UPI0037B2FCEE
MIFDSGPTNLAIQTFIDALNTRDERAFADAVTDKFTYTFDEETGSAADFFTTFTGFVMTSQSSDEHTLTGVMLNADEEVAAQWKFTAPAFTQVTGLTIGTDVEIPDRDFTEALHELDAAARLADTPVGTLRRKVMVRDEYYVYRWGRGAGGAIDWINTGEKAPDPDVYKTFDNPADGDQSDKVRASKVNSRLSLSLGWDDGHQKATVRFRAKPYYWDATVWLEENLALVDARIPVITGRLTLTGPSTLTAPEGRVISSELVTIRDTTAPYLLELTREFPLKDLQPGTYTLTLTEAVKKGGFAFGGKYNTTIKMKDHVISFPVGS